jgi:hypothetical protein
MRECHFWQLADTPMCSATVAFEGKVDEIRTCHDVAN